jgi:hypothetical protein
VREGSVRRSGNRVRIAAQLIDGATNGHVRAERYDRSLDDIFALQDEISQAIVGAPKSGFWAMPSACLVIASQSSMVRFRPSRSDRASPDPRGAGKLRHTIGGSDKLCGRNPAFA